jgi:serine/threonine protein kinase/tetratricopeptide (TPR) repeat protein
MLSPDDLAAVAAIFSEAVDLDPAERAAWIESRCESRPDMLSEVQSLLTAHDRLDAFMEPPDDRDVVARLDGTVIGAWSVRQKIGSGGMGDVYLAERTDGAFEGRAAIKFTRAHLPDMEAARRFRAERQFLASLHHANIVTLLDGGTTPAGQGYLVMEFIEGAPLTAFCRDRNLPLDARLALLRQVCAAVQYAHQRAIVHRDLKPGNILVTSDGVPKVLDFGVAKLVEGTGIDGNVTSAAVQLPLTPNYASPEQLRGLPVTTACDVYSLGVLMYEVLTGGRPYETTGQTREDVIATVAWTEPTRPSDGSLTEGTPYRSSVLRGDLDAIVLKAMRKEPDQRYRSAGELGDDLERFLKREPVLARGPSMGYVLRRVAARHRAAVTVAGAAMFAILAALGVAIWQRQIAVDAQQQSDRRFREVRQLANALIFKIHDSVAKLPGSTPVRQQIVDEALGYLERLERESAGDEALIVELGGGYRQIGSILGDPSFPNLGDSQRALAQLTKARNLIQPLADAPNPTQETLVEMVGIDNVLGRIRTSVGDPAGKIEMAQEAVRYSERALALGMPRGKDLLARSLYALTGTVEPRAARLPYWERTGRLYEELLNEEPESPVRQRNVALVGRNLGGLLVSLGRHDEALPHFERALALDERRLAAAPDNLMAQLDASIEYNQLAGLATRNDPARALMLFRKSLVIRERLAETDPRDVLTRGRLGYARHKVAELEMQNGNLQVARALVRQAVADHEYVLGVTKSSFDRSELAEALEISARVEQALGQTVLTCNQARRAADLLTPSAADSDWTAVYQRARSMVAACDSDLLR